MVLENATLFMVGLMAGALLFRSVLLWLATVYATFHEGHESPRSMAIAASLFNAGPWMLVAAAIFGYFVHSKPWAPWFGAGVAAWGVWHAYFAYRVLKIRRRRRKAEPPKGGEASSRELPPRVE